MSARVIGIQGRIGLRDESATTLHYIMIPKGEKERIDLGVMIGSALATDLIHLLEGDAMGIDLKVYLTDSDDAIANVTGIEPHRVGQKHYPFVWYPTQPQRKGGDYHG